MSVASPPTVSPSNEDEENWRNWAQAAASAGQADEDAGGAAPPPPAADATRSTALMEPVLTADEVEALSECVSERGELWPGE